jgi:hypothetical protein
MRSTPAVRGHAQSDEGGLAILGRIPAAHAAADARLDDERHRIRLASGRRFPFRSRTFDFSRSRVSAFAAGASV